MVSIHMTGTIAQCFRQYLRATNCYKLSDLILPCEQSREPQRAEGAPRNTPPTSSHLSPTMGTREIPVRGVSSMISSSESVNLVHQECWNSPVHTGLSLPVMAWKLRKRRGSGACREKASQDETLSYLDVSVSRTW